MASLNFLERNVLVNGIRGGKTFEEAAKGLPLQTQKHPDLAKTWKAWAEAEAKKDDLATPKTIKLDPEEFMRLREENAELRRLNDKLNSDLSSARSEIEALTAPKKK